MKLSIARFLVAALAAETAVASSWFTKAPYNKWHETELERWLSDHDVPYPTPADRKDLQNIVKENWQSAVESPYANWDTERLQSYLTSKGQQIKQGTEQNKDELVAQVKSAWHDADVNAHNTYDDVKSWIFNTWTTSALKAFCDRHGIPVPQPRTRDQALQVARENYQSAADKAGETAAYPGNWLYEAWTESDLKAWLDEHGVIVPKSTNREKLIGHVRRNSYLARNSLADTASSLSGSATDTASSLSKSATSGASVASQSGSSALSSGASVASNSATSGASVLSQSGKSAASEVSKGAAASASSAYQAVSDALFDTWSDSQLKEWADKNGIKVPQGSRRNEVLAIVRKQAAKLSGDNVSASAASAFGAATSKAGNEFAKATEDAALKASGLAAQASSVAYHYFTEAKIALGLQTNYASSASASASSVYAKASSAVKGEL